MKYDLVIFDFDGTLADTVADVWVSVEYAAALQGGQLSKAFQSIQSNVALPLGEIMKAVEPPLPKELLYRFQQDIAHHYRKLNTFPCTKFYPGIEDILQRIGEADIPVYIVSTKPEEALERVIRVKGWERLFREWLSTECADGSVRTKVQIIRCLLKRHSDAKHAVMIGDTDTDIIAAKECGIASVGVLYGDGGNSRIIAGKPDFIVEHSTELNNILGIEDK